MRHRARMPESALPRDDTEHGAPCQSSWQPWPQAAVGAIRLRTVTAPGTGCRTERGREQASEADARDGHALRPFSSAIGKTSPFPLLSSSGRVVPRHVVRQEAVGLRGTPAAAGVDIDRNDVAEYRVHDAPGGLDGVLPGEEPAIAR